MEALGTLNITFEEALAIYHQDSSVELEFNEMKKFYNLFVSVVPSKVKNVKYYHDRLQRSEIALNCYTIMADLIIDDQQMELVQVQACRQTVKQAKNLAASKLMRIIKTKRPDLFTPAQAIGLPNFRGHCVAVCILCLLLLYPPFVAAIHDYKIRYSGKLINRLFELLRNYAKSAERGSLELFNCPTGIHLKYPHRDIINELKDNPKKSGFKPELVLDKNMMAICSIMVSYGKTDYQKPGALPHKFFADLLDSIAIECSQLSIDSFVDSLFCIKYKTKNGSSHHTYVIEIDAKCNDSIKSIQDLIDKENLLIEDFEEFEQLPEMLTLKVKGPFLSGDRYSHDFYTPSTKNNLKINSNLEIGAANYNLLGQVLPISCFENMITGEKKCRGLPPTITDKFIGMHAVLLMKQGDKFIEMNNHEVLEPLIEHENCQRDSLIFYSKSQNTQKIFNDKQQFYFRLINF